MAERHTVTGKRDARERPPRSMGWRVRAEHAYGTLSPKPAQTLSASEIGAYAFCPQAWFLQRCRLPVTAEMQVRRRAGSQAHRQIGRQTDLMRAAGALQTALIIAMAVVLLLLAAGALRAWA